MRYLLRAYTGYQHLAKKFERAVLTHVGREGSKMAICLRSFLFVSAFYRPRMASTSSLTRSVMWAQIGYHYLGSSYVRQVFVG